SYLPNLNPFFRCPVKLVARLHIKCFIEGILNYQWSESPEITWRMRIGLHLIYHILLCRFCTPYGSPAHKEALILHETTDYSRIAVVFQIHLKCRVRHCYSTKVADILAAGKLTIYESPFHRLVFAVLIGQLIYLVFKILKVGICPPIVQVTVAVKSGTGIIKTV